MRKFVFVFLACLSLMGCAGTANVTEAQKDAVIEQIVSAEESLANLEKNLTDECKTVVIASEIDAQKRNLNLLRVGAENINNACTAEKKALAATIDTWKTRAYSLFIAVVILAWVVLRRVLLGKA